MVCFRAFYRTLWSNHRYRDTLIDGEFELTRARSVYVIYSLGGEGVGVIGKFREIFSLLIVDLCIKTLRILLFIVGLPLVVFSVPNSRGIGGE